MSIHLQRELIKLRKSIFALITEVEESVSKAVQAVKTRDKELASQIIESDIRIDAMEVDVEEECLKILALHQPVAMDLRLIVAFLKINNDLERIGDLAVNIAERAINLAYQPSSDILAIFSRMARNVRTMLKQSLDALVNLDTDLAREVCRADEEVDSSYRQMYEHLKSEIHRDPDSFEEKIQFISIARHLERIADHATNIAEDLIYMAEGEIVRHQRKKGDA